jgi:hypothetical protein
MASRTPGLAIGPMSGVDEAGELTKDVGVHNLASMLLDRHAQLYPLPLVQALSRPRDHERSAALDLGEVQEALERQTGRRAFFREGFELVDASVKGDTPETQVVSVLYVNPETGRSGRGVIPYEEVATATEKRHEQLQEEKARSLLGPAGVPAKYSAASAETADQATEARLQELERQFRDAEAGRQAVQDELDALRDPEPWQGYSDENADAIRDKLKDDGLGEFGRAGLERIRTYEEEHGNRSTVLKAVEEQLAKARQG